jgi:prepilin-type processing-associated H-X9-DG protein
MTESGIQSPSQTPFFYDAVWVDSWPLETDTPARNLLTGGSTLQVGGGIDRLTISRHGGKPASSAPTSAPPGSFLPGSIDISMADGHVELALLETLWTYQWHVNWQTPATRPH